MRRNSSNTMPPLSGHAGKPLNVTFPLPHGVWTSAFAHRNPPRSLWLRHIHRMCRLTRRAHIPFPLCTSFEGTHGTAPRGGTRNAIDFVTIAIPSRCSLRHAHRRVSFTHYATRSPIKRTTLIGSLVLIVKLGARCGRRLAPPRYE